MEAVTIVGAVAGAIAGWILGALFSKGPKTPMEAFRGDYEGGGPSCFVFLLLVVGGAVAGAIVATMAFGGG